MLKYKVSAPLARKRNSFTIDEQECSTSSQASSSASCGSPTCAKYAELRLRSTSMSSVSSSGSCATTQELDIDWGTLKLYTTCIRPNIEYKTLFVSTATSTDDLLRTVLTKLRLTHKDFNLFYVVMIVVTRVDGTMLETELRLENDDRPLALQRLHPKNMARFEMRSHQGVLVRIHDQCINALSNYKSVVIAPHTTTFETVALLLRQQQMAKCHAYVLVMKSNIDNGEHLLPPDAPLVALLERDIPDNFELHLRAIGYNQRTMTHIRESSSSPITSSTSSNNIMSKSVLSHPPLVQNKTLLYYDSLRRPMKKLCSSKSVDWSTRSIRALAAKLQQKL